MLAMARRCEAAPTTNWGLKRNLCSEPVFVLIRNEDRLNPVMLRRDYVFIASMLIGIALGSTAIALTLQRYLGLAIGVAVGPVLAIFGASIFARWLGRLK